MRCSLYDLNQSDCLAPISLTEALTCWQLCEHGLRLIAAASRLHIHNVVPLSDDGVGSETPTVVQRGEVGSARAARKRIGTCALLVGDGASVRTPLPGG